MPEKVYLAIRAHKERQERVPHHNRHLPSPGQLSTLPAQSLLFVLSFPSVLLRRDGGAVWSVVNAGVLLPHVCISAPDSLRIQSFGQESLYVCISSCDELPTTKSCQLSECVLPVSLSNVTGCSRPHNSDHCSRTVNRHKTCKNEKKDIFFTTYLLSLDFWRCGLPAALLRQSLHYYMSFFVCLCFLELYLLKGE